MAPKSSSTGKEKLIDDEEEVLQAVILADSFNKRFRPLTTHKPRCLLPICNAPLLDWTFESLALAGVQEIFVVCRSHAEQVKTAIKQSKWSQPCSGIKIVPILTAKETFSPGDAMRDIYTRGLVTSDFVLVMGDLVSNIRIDEVVRVHRERRKTNKDAIMTMVVKESGAKHRTRAQGDSSVFVLDAETSECLYYEPVTGFPKTPVAHIPREILAEHPEIEIRNDLIDCSIDICSVEVPSLFQDNFDYGDIRKDFVHGVLTSDLLMKNIHCYVAKDGYAARVKDTKSYESVTKDILSRWTFPLVPDDYHPSGHIYNHERGNKYIAKDGTVSLARTCVIGNNTLIGSSTSIDNASKITSSVIGRNCTIGEDVTLISAYIFDGVTIGDHCTIEHSIIGENVAILEGSYIPKGCIIADNVIVGPNARLKPFDRLSAKSDPEEDDEDEDEDDEEVDSDLENLEDIQESIQKDLGSESNALVWPTGPADPEDPDEVEAWTNERLMRLGDDADDLYFSDRGSESGDSDLEDDESSEGEFDPGSLNITSDSLLAPADAAPMAEKEFQAEVKQSLDRAFAEGHSVDNAAVELKTLRMASNVSLTKVRQAVIAGIVERIPIIDEGGIPQRKEIARMVDRWGGLIDQIGGIDPVETITLLQEHCATSERMPLFAQVLAAFYQSDIVEEDDIRKWHKLPGSSARNQDGEVGENMKRAWMIGGHMIKQFDEQESDEDEDDDDADEESSDAEDEKPQMPSAAKVTKPDSEDDEDEDEDEADDESEEDEPPKTPASQSAAPVGVPTPKAKPQSSDEDDDDEEDEEESEEDTSLPTGSTPSKPATSELETTVPSSAIPAPSIANPSGQGEESSEDDTDEDEQQQGKPAEVQRDRSATITQAKPGPHPASKDEDTEGETEEEEEESQDESGPPKKSVDTQRTITQEKAQSPDSFQGVPFPSNRSEGSSIGASHITQNQVNEADQFFRDQSFRKP